MEYKCFHCDKKVDEEYTATRVRCPYCGGKMVHKTRSTSAKVKAR